MPDPVGPLDSECVGRLDEVGDMRREVPRPVGAGAAVPAQVGRDDVARLRPAELGEPLEPLSVTRDAVEADERRGVRVTPAVDEQLHRPDILVRG